MKKTTKLLTLLLSAVLLLSLLSLSAFADAPEAPQEVKPASARSYEGSWAYEDGGWRYYSSYGGMITGWTDIDGEQYYFDSQGFMCSGWLDLGYACFYLGDDGITREGWQYIDGSYYYFNPRSSDQSLVYGHMYRDGFILIDGDPEQPYFFESDGSMSSGCFCHDAYCTYYATSSGLLARGWQYVGDSWYYFEPDMSGPYFDYCAMYSDFHIDGWYLGSDGAAVADTGWTEDSGGWKYIVNGSPLKGLQEIDGSTYYFDTEGYMFTGLMFYIDAPIYFREDGTMFSGGWIELGGAWYYARPDGRCYTDCFAEIDSMEYRFDDMSRAELVSWWESDGNGWRYWYRGGYARRTVLFTNSGRYYFDDTGYMVSGGFHKLGDEEWYIFRDDGTMILAEWYYSEGNWYYTDPDGRLLRNTVAEIDGVRYYFDDNGVSGPASYWVSDDTGWRYWMENHYAMDVQLIDGQYYFFGPNNYMQTGFHDINGWTYYFGSDGAMYMGQWYFDGYFWYYMDESGHMLKATHATVDGEEYFFDYMGASHPARYWVSDDTGWRYVSDEQYVSGVVLIDGSYYYFAEENYMATGFRNIGGWNYYFGADGAMYISQWYYDGSFWYYLDESGHMAESTSLIIDGTEYSFDSQGHML